MSEATLLPVGTILPYCGDNLYLLDAAWLPCDGASYAISEYPELSAALGTAYGSSDPQHFNVPDLRGLFARGCDNGSGRDARVNSRSPLMHGGNSGNAVGSYQDYGTGSPHSPIMAKIPKGNLGKSSEDAGCAAAPGKWNSEDTPISPGVVTNQRSGDLETRCGNVYTNWIIKASTKKVDEPGYTMVPVGAVIAYAGNDPKTVEAGTWLFCDGASVAAKGIYKDLAGVLNRAFGAPDKDSFYLPDFRGKFLRGKDSGAKRDPDVATRKAPVSDAPSGGSSGMSGDAVGSVQGFATALPQKPFTFTLQGLPKSDGPKRVAGAAWDLAGGFDGASVVNCTQLGGDKETRPRNMAVDWFVSRQQPDGSTPDDRVPVGGVIAVGSQTLPGDNYLLCNGRTVSSEQYNELFAAIGMLYGGNPETKVFNLPNYQGVFLRGADHGAKTDPDSASRRFAHALAEEPAVGTAGSYQDYATALPQTPFLATIAHLPTGTHGAHGVTKSDLCEVKGDLTLSTCGTGGDGESVPANVYVQYFIKTRK